MKEQVEIICGVYVSVKYNWEPIITCRDDVADRVGACIFQTENDGRICDGEVEDMLSCASTRVVASFFDRNPDVYRWHYIVLARADNTGPINEIASALLAKGKEPVRGPVVIVKDAPWRHWKGLDKTIDESRVVQTLWYYLRSGVNAEEEFGTRTLIRLMAEKD